MFLTMEVFPNIVFNFEMKFFFIKFDVEGHEIEVIKGGVKLLSRDRSIVLAEIRPENFADFSSLMNEVGLYLLPCKENRSEDMFLFGPHER